MKSGVSRGSPHSCEGLLATTLSVSSTTKSSPALPNDKMGPIGTYVIFLHRAVQELYRLDGSLGTILTHSFRFCGSYSCRRNRMSTRGSRGLWALRIVARRRDRFHHPTQTRIPQPHGGARRIGMSSVPRDGLGPRRLGRPSRSRAARLLPPLRSDWGLGSLGSVGRILAVPAYAGCASARPSRASPRIRHRSWGCCAR